MAGLRFVVAASFLIACSGRAQPAEFIPSDLRVSTLDHPGLTITLRANRTTLTVGDTVTFVIAAHNSTGQKIRVGAPCGPSMDVRVRAPNASHSSALLAQFEDSDMPVAFTCELGPYHFAPPQDSLVNIIRWRAPSRGTFVALAGGRGHAGLHDVSSPLILTVR